MEGRIYSHWEQLAAAKSIAKSLRNRKVQCKVLRGNGSTSPIGSDDGGNYFIIEPDTRRNRTWADKRDELYLNFDMNKENANRIKTHLDSIPIPYKWSGHLTDCFIFKTSDFIKP